MANVTTSDEALVAITFRATKSVRIRLNELMAAVSLQRKEVVSQEQVIAEAIESYAKKFVPTK